MHTVVSVSVDVDVDVDVEGVGSGSSDETQFPPTKSKGDVIYLKIKPLFY